MATRQISAELKIRWTHDETEFYRRCVTAATANSEFRGVRQSALWQPFRAPAIQFHRSHSRKNLSLEAGANVRVLVSAAYDPRQHSGQVFAVKFTDPASLVPEVAPAPAPRTVNVRIRVLDARSIDRLGGVGVQLVGGATFEAKANAKGIAEIPNVPWGKYVLVVDSDDHRGHSEQVAIRGHREWSHRVLLEPIVYLKFTGRRLLAFSGGTEEKSWPAWSGNKGHMTKEHQKKANVGPIPEGWWNVTQKAYQEMGKRSVYERAKSVVGGSAWPGGVSAWGRHRVWLHPKPGTNAHGRSGFSIHGGHEPGSAGCIDLVNRMSDFAVWFRMYSKDVDLLVEYR